MMTNHEYQPEAMNGDSDLLAGFAFEDVVALKLSVSPRAKEEGVERG